MESDNIIPPILRTVVKDIHENQFASTIPTRSSTLKLFTNHVNYLKKTKMESLIDITTFFNVRSFDYRDQFANDNTAESGPILLVYMFYARLYDKLMATALGNGSIQLFGPINLEDRVIGFREVIDFMEDFDTARASLGLNRVKWQRIWAAVAPELRDVDNDKWRAKLNFEEFLSLLCVACEVAIVPPAWKGLDTPQARLRRFFAELDMGDVISAKARLLNVFRDRHMQRFAQFPTNVLDLPHRATLLAKPKGPVAPLPRKQQADPIRDGKLRGWVESKYVYLTKKALWEAYEGPWIDMGVCELGDGPANSQKSEARVFRLRVQNKRFHMMWYQVSVEGCEAIRVVHKQSPLPPGCSAEVLVEALPKNTGEWCANIAIDVVTARGDAERARVPVYLRCCMPGVVPTTQHLPVHAPERFRLKANAGPFANGAPSSFDPSMVYAGTKLHGTMNMNETGDFDGDALMGVDGISTLKKRSLGGGIRPGSAFTLSGLKAQERQNQINSQHQNRTTTSPPVGYVGGSLLGRKSKSASSLPGIGGAAKANLLSQMAEGMLRLAAGSPGAEGAAEAQGDAAFFRDLAKDQLIRSSQAMILTDHAVAVHEGNRRLVPVNNLRDQQYAPGSKLSLGRTLPGGGVAGLQRQFSHESDISFDDANDSPVPSSWTADPVPSPERRRMILSRMKNGGDAASFHSSPGRDLRAPAGDGSLDGDFASNNGTVLDENDDLFGPNGAIGRGVLDPANAKSKEHANSIQIVRFTSDQARTHLASSNGPRSPLGGTGNLQDLKKITFAPGNAQEVREVMDRRMLGGEIGRYNSFTAKQGSFFQEKSRSNRTAPISHKNSGLIQL